MNLKNLLNKRFIMLDAKNASITETDNMFDNCINNDAINDLFEKYNIPNKYRYFIFKNSLFFDIEEFITDISIKNLPVVRLNDKGEKLCTFYLNMHNYAFVYIGETNIIFEKDLKEFFDNMKKDNVFDNYILVMNLIFSKLYQSKQNNYSAIKRGNNKVLSLKNR